MFVYKKLKASDVGITAFEAHKEYTSGDLYYGRYNSASKDTYSQFNLNNELEYFQLDHLFYKDPIFKIGNLNGGINYIDQEKRLYDKALIISIPQSKFGSAIQKGTVTIDSTYVDDSKGNLYKSSETISNYPQDKERVLYVGPVKGFKRTDLTRDLKTGELLVNPPSTYSDTQIDDSLYANPIIYNSSSLEHISDLNCTAIQLATGSVKIPHSSNFNFNNDDFTISFYYKSDNTTNKIVIDKSTSQPTVLAATDTSLGSQTTEEKVNSIPYEITVGSDVTFKRTDIDGVTSTYSAGSISADTLYHIACVKTGSALKIYVDGVKIGSDGTDNTNICRNKSDVLIGRTEDVEAQVSQLMIWNRGLSTTEIANVSESIDGSPYVGNVFYENGIVTFTSPKYNNNFATISTSNTTLTLNATDWIEGETTTQNVTFPTFNGEFTFFNQNHPFNHDYTDNIPADFISNVLESSNPSPLFNTQLPYTIKLYSPLYKNLYSNIDLNPLTSSQDDNYTTYSELSPITTGIPGIYGTSSGELGIDSDSSSSIYNPQSFGSAVGIYLVENQTVTESINILFASNSQEVVSETFPYTDTSISNTVFEFSNGGTYGTNDGGAYVNNTNVAYGYLMVSGTYENGAYFQGQLRGSGGPGAQVINDQNYNQLNFTLAQLLNGDSYVVADGLVQGSDFNLTEDWIEILETPEYGSLTFQVTASFQNITGYPGSGPGAYLSARLRKSSSLGTTTVWEPLDSFYIGSDDSYSLQDEKLTIQAITGDKFLFEVRVSDGSGTWFNGYQIGNRYLKIIGESGGALAEGFKNQILLHHGYTPKANSIYSYNLQGIVTRPGAGGAYDTEFSTNNTTGLSQDLSGNEVGVRVSLLQGSTLITSSLFPSSSGDTEQNFSYDHFTSDNTDELHLYVYPGISSHTDPVRTGEAQGFFIGSLASSNKGFYIVEKSGSNIIHLNSNLTNHFTSSDNISSQITFTDTTNLMGNTTPNPVDIEGFISDDPTQIQVDGVYLITGSFYATASLERGNYISGSSSIDISEDEYGIYFIDNLDIRTFGWGDGIIGLNSDQKVKITTKVDGTILDTRYVNAPTSTTNAFESGELELGVLNSSNNVSFEYTVVSGSSNELDTVVKNQGFSINEINIRRITSSNQFTRVDGGEFDNIESIDYVAFFPFFNNDGNPNLPFTDVPSEADEILFYVYGNVSSFSNDNKILYLDEYFFVTESITINSFRQNGPFEVYYINAIDTLVPGKEYDVQFTGSVTTENDGVTNEGAGIRILDQNNNIIKEIFVDSSTNTLESTNDLRIKDYRVTENTSLKMNTFISGTSSPLYPDGIISSSITASFNIEVNIFAKSGSTISNETIDPADFTVISGSEDWIYSWSGEGVAGNYTASQTNPTNTLHITSSHSTYTGDDPSLNFGEFNVVGVQLTGNKLEVATPLFITASSIISGTAPSTIEVLDSVIPVMVNPFTIDETPTEGLLGYTFEYINPVDNEVETLMITAIDDDNNTITVNNGQGLYQVGTYDDQSTQEITVATSSISFTGGSVNFKNTHLIFENEFQCTVEEDEFNFTLNPTARKYKSIERGELANFATGSNFKPYVTTIGLYNDEGELLVVGKLAQPVRMSDETDTTFVVRFDT